MCSPLQMEKSDLDEAIYVPCELIGCKGMRGAKSRFDLPAHLDALGDTGRVPQSTQSQPNA